MSREEHERGCNVVCGFGTSWINQALNADVRRGARAARRGVMRGNEPVKNSTCALVLGGQCHRDAGLLEDGEGTHLHQWRRRTTSRGGCEQRWSRTTMASKSGTPWGYQAERSCSAPQSEPTCGCAIDRCLTLCPCYRSSHDEGEG